MAPLLYTSTTDQTSEESDYTPLKPTPTKVAVLGAGGAIGQTLCLLFKLSPLVDEIACYDIVGTPGVAADLSHISTKSVARGYLPSDNGLVAALSGATMVVIPAGVPRKPGMTRDDLFRTNAGIMKTLIEGCAEYCPTACIAIISNPVNSLVPLAAEVMKSKGVYDRSKICGVTMLDVIRADTFVAESQGWDPKDINVPVIGGHAGETILPLFSRVPGVKMTDEDLETLTRRTQFGGDEVVKAKAGKGSATLSMSYAGFTFCENVLKGMKGEEGIVQCAYVESNLTKASFLSSPCRFGTNGIEEILPLGELTTFEQSHFDKMLPTLTDQIEKGVTFLCQDKRSMM